MQLPHRYTYKWIVVLPSKWSTRWDTYLAAAEDAEGCSANSGLVLQAWNKHRTVGFGEN